MNAIRYLDYDTIVGVNLAYGGPGAGVINRQGVETQIGRPATVLYGLEQFDTLWLKAAVLMHGLASTQYFSDGNKRTAWVSACLFLELNGASIKDTPDVEAEAFVLSVATQLFSIEKAAEWFEARRITAEDRKGLALIARTGSASDEGLFTAEDALLGGLAAAHLPAIGTIVFIAHFRWFPHDKGKTKTLRLSFEGVDPPAQIVEPTEDWKQKNRQRASGDPDIAIEDVTDQISLELHPFETQRPEEPRGVAPTVTAIPVTVMLVRPGTGWLIAELDGEVFARLQLDVHEETWNWDSLASVQSALTTVAEIFVQANVGGDDPDPITDRRFSLTCPSCGKLQSLAQSTISASNAAGMLTEYGCLRCEETLVRVGHWGFQGSEDKRRAYRLNDFGFYSAADLYLRVGSALVHLPIE